MYKAKPRVKKIIEEYKQALQKLGINVEGVILYGSFAKGNQREDSDIDLVIVSNNFQKMNLRERLEILGIAAVKIMKPVEAKGYTPKEIKMAPQASFLENILEVGINTRDPFYDTAGSAGAIRPSH